MQTAMEKLNWTAGTESLVDSSFFWGYMITQVPGGFLASFFPANRIFGIAICTSAVLNMTVPGAMHLNNVTVLLIIRVLQGLVEVNISYTVKLILIINGYVRNCRIGKKGVCDID